MKKRKYFGIGAVVLVSAMFLLTSLSVSAAPPSGQSHQTDQTHSQQYLFPGLFHRQWFDGKVIINSGAIVTWIPGAGFEIAGYYMLFECLRDGDPHELYLEGGIAIDYGGGGLITLRFPPYTESDPLTWGGSGYLWLRFPHWCPLGDIVDWIEIDFDVYLDDEYVGHYYHRMEIDSGSPFEPL